MIREFEWDPEKNEKNIVRHKIAFEDAVALFESPFLEHQEIRKGYGEMRWVRLAKLEGCIVSAVYTYRGNKIRIISVRRANHYERKIYQRENQRSHELELSSQDER